MQAVGATLRADLAREQRCLVLALAGPRIETAESAGGVFAIFQTVFDAYGSERQLLTGLPMPGQRLAPLIIRNAWKIGATNRTAAPEADDAVITRALDLQEPRLLGAAARAGSALVEATAARSGAESEAPAILVAPILSIARFHGLAVMTLGAEAARARDGVGGVGAAERHLVGAVLNAGFRRLRDLGAVTAARAGALSAREREVLSLTALGRTAPEAADRLGVTERTVTAHLQSATRKLAAKNKAEAVAQALRYREIGPGAGIGFQALRSDVFEAKAYDYRRVFG